MFSRALPSGTVEGIAPAGERIARAIGAGERIARAIGDIIIGFIGTGLWLSARAAGFG